MAYPVKKYKYRPPLYQSTINQIRNVIPWKVPDYLEDSAQKFLDITVGSEYGEAELDAKRIQIGLMPRFTSNVDMPYMVWTGELSGGYPTIRNGAEIANIAGKTFVLVKSNSELWAKFPNDYEFEKYVAMPASMIDTTGLSYAIDNTDTSGYYFCVQTTASISGLRIFDESFNLISSTMFDVKEQSHLMVGADETHDGVDPTNSTYFYF